MEETEIAKLDETKQEKSEKKKWTIVVSWILIFLMILFILMIMFIIDCQNSNVTSQVVGKWNGDDITISIEDDGTFQFNFVPIEYGYFIDASGNWEKDSSTGTQTIYHLTSSEMRFSRATDSQNADTTLLCSLNIDSDDPDIAAASFTVMYKGKKTDDFTFSLRRSE